MTPRAWRFPLAIATFGISAWIHVARHGSRTTRWKRSLIGSGIAWLISIIGLALTILLPLGLIQALTYPNDPPWWPEGWGIPLFLGGLAAWLIGAVAFWVVLWSTDAD